MNPAKRGYLYALLATICGSLVYLFSKAALLEVSLAQFGFWWFALALVWNSAMAVHPRGGFSLKGLGLADYKTLILMGLVEIVATTSLYAAIAIADNPTVPSFLRNLEYLFISLLGMILLSERYSRLSGTGALLVLSGAFLVGLKTGNLKGLLSTTSALMLLSTSFYAIRTILAKKHIKEIGPVMLAINRAIFLLLFASLFLILNNDSLLIPGKAFLNILAGSFVGPFLTSVFQYSALSYIEASRAAIVQSTTGMFVLGGSLLMFGLLPSGLQMAGGAVTVAGVALMMRARKLSG
jgi:drug/metabolite transporter (DMT)-like permease